MIPTSSATLAVERQRRARPAPAFARVLLPILLASLVGAGGARAQSTTSSSSSAAAPHDLERLVSRALSVNPSIRAARDRVEAAGAAIGPAGALPDPMLMAGVMNLPVSDPGFDDFMTMKTLGLRQMLPFPGKLALRRRVAEAELASAEASLEASRWTVIAAVKEAYYDLAFYDQALGIVRRNEQILTNFVRVTESRYGVGTGSQADVLKARVETSRLAEEAAALTEQRRAALARLNAALDRPSDDPVPEPVVPERVARAAVPTDAREVRFTSAALGSRVADSPLPPLAEMQETAVQESPQIRAHEAMIAAQAARVELARKAHLPDFDISVQYGQRDGRSDMLSAAVSVPLPLRRESRQKLTVKEAQARLSALQAEHHEKANELRAQVARAYADLEKQRTQLALFLKSIIPQGRAALESATASFQVGRVDFLALLESQTTLYSYETAYYRSLTDFAERLAELERTVGKELL